MPPTPHSARKAVTPRGCGLEARTAWVHRPRLPEYPTQVWYFRVVELAPDKWACRHGDQTFDTHQDMTQAVDHLRTLAARKQPAELFVHRLDGTAQNLGTVLDRPAEQAGTDDG